MAEPTAPASMYGHSVEFIFMILDKGTGGSFSFSFWNISVTMTTNVYETLLCVKFKTMRPVCPEDYNSSQNYNAGHISSEHKLKFLSHISKDCCVVHTSVQPGPSFCLGYIPEFLSLYTLSMLSSINTHVRSKHLWLLQGCQHHEHICKP